MTAGGGQSTLQMPSSLAINALFSPVNLMVFFPSVVYSFMVDQPSFQDDRPSMSETPSLRDDEDLYL